MFALGLLTIVSAVAALPAALAHPLTKRTPAAVYTECTVPNTVALTFDDGPFDYNDDIVNTLNSNDIKATFFLNGNNFQCIYSPENVARLQNIYNSGHQVASHGWSHADLATLSPEKIGDELDRINNAFVDILGVMPSAMRPPFGSYNDDVLEVAGSRGQDVAMWNFDTLDSAGASSSDMISSYDNFIASHPSSIISLAHETYKSSAHEVLQHAITSLSGAGYKFVTFSECIGKSPYLSVGTPKTTGGSC